MPETLSPEIVSAVRAHPKFAILLRRRGRLSRALAGVVLGAFALLVLMMAFAPTLAARPIADGYTLTYGLTLGLAIMVSLVITTATYVHRSNHEFEELTREIVADIKP